MTDLNEETDLAVAERMANNNANLSPEEIAATFFANYYPTYKFLISKLNKKDAIRLSDALVGFPLEMKEPKFFNEDAKRAFWIANQLLDCKLIMRSAVEIDLMNEAQKKSLDAETSMSNDAVNEGEIKNG